jgi:hypothetical protein
MDPIKTTCSEIHLLMSAWNSSQISHPKIEQSGRKEKNTLREFIIETWKQVKARKKGRASEGGCPDKAKATEGKVNSGKTESKSSENEDDKKGGWETETGAGRESLGQAKQKGESEANGNGKGRDFNASGYKRNKSPFARKELKT